MARKKTNNPRNKHIDVRLTEEEFNHFKFKAASTGLTASEYIRNIGMSYPLKSMVDQLAVDELIKVRADFGRVGGLFKKWLVAQEGRTGNIGSKNYEDVNKIVEELELKQIEILRIAQKIMKGIRDEKR